VIAQPAPRNSVGTEAPTPLLTLGILEACRHQQCRRTRLHQCRRRQHQRRSVVVTVPNDVLEKLTHQSYPSQGWATIIAALIALVAAGTALFGVWLKVRADANEANNARTAETENTRRAERIRLLAEAVEQTLSMFKLAHEMHYGGSGTKILATWTSSCKQCLSRSWPRTP
jgi:hypothetical protein